MSDKRVLLVDDDEVLRELLTMILQHGGCNVSTAENGSVAQQVLADNDPFDLIVLDLMMPVLDGMGFLDWLRGERASDVPVLVMSGMEQEGIADELRAMGASAVLFKPVKVPELLQTIQAL